jgi:hypothetical protein
MGRLSLPYARVAMLGVGKCKEFMLDIIFVVLTLVFFAISLWYVRFCDKA